MLVSRQWRIFPAGLFLVFTFLGLHVSTSAQDVDECALGTDGCAQNCTNTDGSFYCSCRDGYRLNADARNCDVCEQGKYGTGCSQDCQCSDVNTLSCDHVTGACTCRTGWEGQTCSDDVNECTGSGNNCTSTNSLCENTPGSFRCVCVQNFARNSDGICVAITRLRFKLTVDVTPAFDDTDNTSTSYRNLAASAKTAIAKVFEGKAAAPADIVIISLSKGSLTIEAEALIEERTKTVSASLVTTELRNLHGQNLTIGSLTGSTAVQVGTLQVDKQTSLCDIYLALDQCGDHETCEWENGVGTCRWKLLSYESNLVIGLSIGVPLAIIITGLLIFGVYFWITHERRKQRKKQQRGEKVLPNGRQGTLPLYEKTSHPPYFLYDNPTWTRHFDSVSPNELALQREKIKKFYTN